MYILYLFLFIYICLHSHAYFHSCASLFWVFTLIFEVFWFFVAFFAYTNVCSSFNPFLWISIRPSIYLCISFIICLCTYFSRRVAKGSRFTLGVWELTRVRVTLLLVPATVCNRLCMTVVGLELACLWGKPQERVFLDLSQDVFITLCVPGLAPCGIQYVSEAMRAHDCRWSKVDVSIERRCVHVALRANRGTLWHPMCLRRKKCAWPSWT